MVKEKTKVAERAAVVAKNIDEVRFAGAPFYNLTNVRREFLKLITRTKGDEAKTEVLRETLAVLGETLEARAAHAKEVRTREIAAAAKADKLRAERAAASAKAKDEADLAAALDKVRVLEDRLGVTKSAE